MHEGGKEPGVQTAQTHTFKGTTTRVRLSLEADRTSTICSRMHQNRLKQLRLSSSTLSRPSRLCACILYDTEFQNCAGNSTQRPGMERTKPQRQSVINNRNMQASRSSCFFSRN
eukprot:6278784-Amphidinium_carterae.1